MCNLYKRRPSEIMEIKDVYTAYCLDEACSYIIRQIEDGNEPMFKRKVSSFKELYAAY